jgi:cytochrome P450
MLKMFIILTPGSIRSHLSAALVFCLSKMLSVLNRPWLATVAIFALCSFVLRAVTRRVANARFAASKGCLPPTPLPQSERLLGLGLLRQQKQAASSHTLLSLFQQRFDANGNTWSAVLAGRRFICTIEPENVRSILQSNFVDYSVGGSRVKAFGPLLGNNGVFTADGAAWEHSRVCCLSVVVCSFTDKSQAILRPSFARDRISDLDALEVHVAHLLHLLPQNDSTVVDLQPLFYRFTLDSSTEFLFGESVESLLDDPNTPRVNFAEMFDYAQSEMVTRFRLGPLLAFYRNKRFYESCHAAHDFVDKYVAGALQRRHDGKTTEHKGEKYIVLDEIVKETQDPDQLRSAVLNILLAGRDTTASLLGNTFFVLSQRPDVWDKIKAEVDNLGGRKPTYEALRDLKYIRYVLNESELPADLPVGLLRPAY